MQLGSLVGMDRPGRVRWLREHRGGDLSAAVEAAVGQGLPAGLASESGLAWAVAPLLDPGAARLQAPFDALWDEWTRPRRRGRTTGLTDLAWSAACDQRTDGQPPGCSPRSPRRAFLALLARSHEAVLAAIPARCRELLAPADLEECTHEAWAQLYAGRWAASAGGRYLGLAALEGLLTALAVRRVCCRVGVGESDRPAPGAVMPGTDALPAPGELGAALRARGRMAELRSCLRQLPPRAALGSFCYHARGLGVVQIVKGLRRAYAEVLPELNESWETLRRLLAGPRQPADGPEEPPGRLRPDSPRPLDGESNGSAVPRAFEPICDAVLRWEDGPGGAKELDLLEGLASFAEGSASLAAVPESFLGDWLERLGPETVADVVIGDGSPAGSDPIDDLCARVLRLCPPGEAARLADLYREGGAALLPAVAGAGDLDPRSPAAIFATLLRPAGPLSWQSDRFGEPDGTAPRLWSLSPGEDLTASGVVRFDTGRLHVATDRFPADGRWRLFALAGDELEATLVGERELVLLRRDHDAPPAGAGPGALVARGYLLDAWLAALAAGWSDGAIRCLLLPLYSRMADLLAEGGAAVGLRDENRYRFLRADFEELAGQRLNDLKQGLVESLLEDT